MTHAHIDQLSSEDVRRFGSDPVATFRANLAIVEDRIAHACALAGRDRASVRLLPITKTVPAHVLRCAWDVGITTFGENKVQEAISKREALSDLAVEWSIVGHLQSNKAKFLPTMTREFHALDSLRIAKLLNDGLAAVDRSMDVFIQVNTSGEASKYGLKPDDLLPFVDALHKFPRLNPRGLMTLAVLSADMDKVWPCFALLRSLRDKAIARHAGLTALSMGMTGDFELAIAEGATVVRIGQAIFGKRPTPEGHYWPGVAIDR